MFDTHTTEDGRIVVGATVIVDRTAHSTDAAIDIGRTRVSGQLQHIGNSDPGESWGNPHRIDDIVAEENVSQQRARELSIQRFEEDLKQLLKQEDSHWRSALKELQGETLECWCAPQDCHGRILAEWAERLVEWDS